MVLKLQCFNLIPPPQIRNPELEIELFRLWRNNSILSVSAGPHHAAFLIFFAVYAEFILVAMDKADDVAPVLPQNQGSQEKRQEHDDRVRIEIPSGKREAGPSPDRSQRHILRQQE